MRRVCPAPGCPVLVDTGERACAQHRRQREQERGSRAARGYDTAHDQLRAQWAPCVATGTVTCWRCQRLISTDDTWHLGHDDRDRSRYRGPEHAACNLSAAGRASHGLPWQPPAA